MADMKIIYMGTPDFAELPLRKIVEAGYNVEMVIAQPDKPNGRGKKIKPGPVKKAAEELGIPVAQPEKIKNNPAFIDEIRQMAPDLIIVAAYGKILPPELLEIPKYGCVNIHGSLLPRFRGAAPIQRCIMAGDKLTGVTLMYMAEGLDTGDMIAVRTTEVGKKNAGQLFDELSLMGAELMVEWIPKFADDSIERIPQNDDEACYASMIEKSEGRIDFNDAAAGIECRIRGLSPSPGAFTELNGERMKIHEADVLESCAGEPGVITDVSDKDITVACGEGSLKLKVIQMPGKRAMNVADFLRGHSIEKGTVLG